MTSPVFDKAITQLTNFFLSITFNFLTIMGLLIKSKSQRSLTTCLYCHLILPLSESIEIKLAEKSSPDLSSPIIPPGLLVTTNSDFVSLSKLKPDQTLALTLFFFSEVDQISFFVFKSKAFIPFFKVAT